MWGVQMHRDLEAQIRKLAILFFSFLRYFNVSEGDYFKNLFLATQAFLETYASEEQFLESLEM